MLTIHFPKLGVLVLRALAAVVMSITAVPGLAQQHAPADSAAVAAVEEIVLTDADVAQIIATNRAGVFYAWSPHMPLSVDGLAEIFGAAERLGINVTPLLSPHSSTEFAREQGLRVNAPADAYRLDQSLELAKRNLHVHAPAILVYANGDFVSPVIPGFRDAANYENLIRNIIDAL